MCSWWVKLIISSVIEILSVLVCKKICFSTSMSAINTFVSLCTSISYWHFSEIIKLLIFLYFNLITWPIPYSKAVLRSLVIHCIAINKKNKQNLSLILYLYLICSSSPILFRQPIKHVKEQPVCNIYQTYNRPNTLMGSFWSMTGIIITGLNPTSKLSHYSCAVGFFFYIKILANMRWNYQYNLQVIIFVNNTNSQLFNGFSPTLQFLKIFLEILGKTWQEVLLKN